MNRILIISGCTADKAVTDSGHLTLEDFSDPARLDARQADLWHLAMPAAQRYRGEEHLRTLDAIESLRESGHRVDHAIVSAGYGLVEPHQSLAPYDATFDGMDDAELEAWATHLDLPDAVRSRCLKADRVALVLPWTYRKAIGPLSAEPGQRLIRLDPFGAQAEHIRALATRAPTRFASVAEDARFLRAFESSQIPMPDWTHRAHLRMAWLMADQGEPEAVIPRVKRALIGLLTAYGIPQTETRGYHETVTLAWLKLIQTLRQTTSHRCADTFIDEHPQLLDKTYLLTFYSRAAIMGGDAREKWVEPDLRPLP